MVLDKQNIIITKASGERTLFLPNKLKLSLHRAGANDETIDAIMSEMESRVYEGIPTTEIYKIAFSLLKNKSRPAPGRYKLKRAIMELGPSGFPFEKYIAAILLFSSGFFISFITNLLIHFTLDCISCRQTQKIK